MDQRRRQFCKLIVSGMGKADAAIEAGYSQHGAGGNATRLLKMASVKNEIIKLRKELDARVEEDERARLKDHYDTPLDLFMDIVNNPAMPYSARVQAAKEALPYTNAKLGPKGKKAMKEEAAQAANGTGKFAPGARPKLRAVG